MSADGPPMGPFGCQGKQAWPELLNKSAEFAKQTILRENPTVKNVVLIQTGEPRLYDIHCDRVMLYITHRPNGIVIEIPRIR